MRFYLCFIRIFFYHYKNHKLHWTLLCRHSVFLTVKNTDFSVQVSPGSVQADGTALRYSVGLRRLWPGSLQGHESLRERSYVLADVAHDQSHRRSRQQRGRVQRGSSQGQSSWGLRLIWCRLQCCVHRNQCPRVNWVLPSATSYFE